MREETENEQKRYLTRMMIGKQQETFRTSYSQAVYSPTWPEDILRAILSIKRKMETRNVLICGVGCQKTPEKCLFIAKQKKSINHQRPCLGCKRSMLITKSLLGVGLLLSTDGCQLSPVFPPTLIRANVGLYIHNHNPSLFVLFAYCLRATDR